LQACIRCGACIDVCPVRGISPAHLESGLRNLGTPHLTGYCMIYRGLETPSVDVNTEWKMSERTSGGLQTCFDCIAVCPTGALEQVDVAHLQLGTAVVDHSYCKAWRYGSCTFPCEYVCPFDAISITAGPIVEEAKCVGCGQCEYVCLARKEGPTGISVFPR
jgi:ferredoxin-type protein NapG